MRLSLVLLGWVYTLDSYFARPLVRFALFTGPAGGGIDERERRATCVVVVLELLTPLSVMLKLVEVIGKLQLQPHLWLVVRDDEIKAQGKVLGDSLLARNDVR